MSAQTLSNPSQFPVFVPELGKLLAPHETITVADAKVVARHVATGVLTDDGGDSDAKAVARWHDEHQTLPEQVAQPGETVGEPPEARVKPPEPQRGTSEHTGGPATRNVVKGREVNRGPKRETR